MGTLRKHRWIQITFLYLSSYIIGNNVESLRNACWFLKYGIADWYPNITNILLWLRRKSQGIKELVCWQMNDVRDGVLFHKTKNVSPPHGMKKLTLWASNKSEITARFIKNNPLLLWYYYFLCCWSNPHASPDIWNVISPESNEVIKKDLCSLVFNINSPHCWPEGGCFS